MSRMMGYTVSHDCIVFMNINASQAGRKCAPQASQDMISGSADWERYLSDMPWFERVEFELWDLRSVVCYQNWEEVWVRPVSYVSWTNHQQNASRAEYLSTNHNICHKNTISQYLGLIAGRKCSRSRKRLERSQVPLTRTEPWLRYRDADVAVA